MLILETCLCPRTAQCCQFVADEHWNKRPPSVTWMSMSSASAATKYILLVNVLVIGHSTAHKIMTDMDTFSDKKCKMWHCCNCVTLNFPLYHWWDQSCVLKSTSQSAKSQRLATNRLQSCCLFLAGGQKNNNQQMQLRFCCALSTKTVIRKLLLMVMMADDGGQ